MPAPTLELLLSEADWLRRLAHHLVKDPGTADEVVQETWIAALKSDPGVDISADPTRRRGWLAQVARRIAGRQYSREQRRGERQAVAVTLQEQDGGPSPTAVTERMELQQQVATAILHVDEPYRQTLYLLYYEGRSAAEVSRMTGVSESTVRTRAFRGRSEVRRQLCKDGQDWTAWSAALAPWLRLGTASPSAAVGAGATSAGAVWSGGRWAAALLLCGALLGGAWMITRDAMTVPPSDVPTPTASVADAESSLPAMPLDSEAARLTPAAPTGRNANRSSEPSPALVFGEVVGPSGDPVRGAYLTLERGLEVLKARSDPEDGSWALPSVPGGSWSVIVFEAGHRPWYGDIEVDGPAPQELSVTLIPKTLVPIRFMQPDGTALIGEVGQSPRQLQSIPHPIPLEDRQGPPAPGERSDPLRRFGMIPPPVLYPSVVVTATEPPSVLSDAPAGRLWRYGGGAWRERGNTHGARALAIPQDCQGELEIQCDLPAWVSLVYGNIVLESKLIETAPAMMEFAIDQERLRSEHRCVRFATHDAVTGENVSEAFLAGHASIRVDNVTPTWVGLENHQVTIYEVPPGAHVIHVGQLRGAYEQVALASHVLPGVDAGLAPVTLRSVKPFQVTVRDEAGAPVQAFVRAHRAEGAAATAPEFWSGHASTDAAGVAAVESVAEGLVSIRVDVRGKRLWFGATIDTSQESALEVTVPATTLVKVKRRPLDPRLKLDLFDSAGRTLNTLGLLNGTLHLAPGSYTIRRRLPDGHGPAHPLLVGEEPMSLDPQDYL